MVTSSVGLAALFYAKGEPQRDVLSRKITHVEMGCSSSFVLEVRVGEM